MRRRHESPSRPRQRPQIYRKVLPMANSLIIVKQLILLFSIMFAGYLSFKQGWVTRKGSSQISSLIVKIFNPALIIATSIGSEYKPSAHLIIMNIILVAAFFGSLILLSPVICRLLRVDEENRVLFRIMFTFCNLGFMGIPLLEVLLPEARTEPFLARLTDMSAATLEAMVTGQEYRAFPVSTVQNV